MKKGSVDDCKKYCDSVPNCHSFDYQKKKKQCYLKDKQLNGNEPLECWDSMFTVYKDCIQGTKQIRKLIIVFNKLEKNEKVGVDRLSRVDIQDVSLPFLLQE